MTDDNNDNPNRWPTEEEVTELHNQLQLYMKHNTDRLEAMRGFIDHFLRGAEACNLDVVWLLRWMLKSVMLTWDGNKPNVLYALALHVGIPVRVAGGDFVKDEQPRLAVPPQAKRPSARAAPQPTAAAPDNVIRYTAWGKTPRGNA